MRKQMYLLLGITVLTVLMSCSSVPVTAAQGEPQSEFTFTEGSIQEARGFLRLHGYYIATVDGDQPQVRPFGTAAIFEGKLYIVTSKAKNVSKQMELNPNITIVAHEHNSVNWMRITATAVNDDRFEAKQAVLADHSEMGLERLYPPDDENTQVLYLKDATATVYAYTTTQITFQF